MSHVDSEQEIQISLKTTLVVDGGLNDNNAETDRTENNPNSKSEVKKSLPLRLLNTFGINTQFYALLVKMYNVLKELSLMVFIALTYAALTNNTPRVSKSPPAAPFFSKSSIVEDWYNGELSSAMVSARQSEISFIMFYAPWDASSQALRYEFEIAAQYMHKEVRFLALNCWQPRGECHTQYPKSYSWPVLIAYLPRGKGIYYKGINSAPYIVKFLESLLRPLIRIYHEHEMDQLLATNDAVVLGCLNAFPGSPDYGVLYSTAINLLAIDIPVAILTGANNSCVRDYDRVLSLHLWNETLIYPNNEEWEPEAVLKWIQNNLHTVTLWTLPPGTKSNLLSNYLQPGPAMILFTPKNPLSHTEDYYNLLREVALEYYDCSENRRVKMSSVLTNALRIENYLKHKQELEECKLKKEIKTSNSSFPTVITYTLPNKIVNITCCANERNHPDLCSKCEPLDIFRERFPSEHNQGCSESYQYQHQLNSNLYKSCDTPSNKKPNLEDRVKPGLSMILKGNWEEEKCHRLKFAQKLYPNVYSNTVKDKIERKKSIKIVKTIGLSCKTNDTLTFIALDSLHSHFFAERLGIDLSSRKDRTAAVIINDKMETHHIMPGVINDQTLRQFVTNFTNNNIVRSINSYKDINNKYTHVYSSQESCDAEGSSQFCLTELNSKTFLPTVLQHGQVVLVLYYSKQCAFCSGISYTFLTVARMFSSSKILRFVRIDGDLNILPWEFTMETYPTILFFPFQRKEETRVYPQNMPVTVSNIIKYLLSNLNPSLRLHAMQMLCKQTKVEEDRLMCIVSMRSENLALIDRTLRAWRTADVPKKAKLLYKLQQLRNINLLLTLYPQNNDALDRYFTQLHRSTEEDILVKSARTYIKDEL